MAETNPLFVPEETAETYVRWHVPLAPPPSEAIEAKVYRAAMNRFKQVTDVFSASTEAAGLWAVTGEGDRFVLDLSIDPAIPGMKRVAPAVLICPGMEPLTLDDLVPSRPAHYEPRNLSASQATAFSNIEALRDTPNLLRHLTRYLRSIFQPPYGTALAGRIEKLAEMVREESDGEMALSGDSLASLISFIERNPKLVRPSVVAGPSGELIAIWKGSEAAAFTARFLPNGAIRFLLSRSNKRHPSGVSRLSGDTTADKLFAEAGLKEVGWLFRG